MESCFFFFAINLAWFHEKFREWKTTNCFFFTNITQIHMLF